MTETISAAQFRKQASKPKRSKYGNTRVEFEGEWFDSLRELNRFKELRLMERAGEISHLERQPKFKLFCGNAPIKFDSGRQAVYRADFAYFSAAENKRVVEDSKGFRTPEYKLKRAIVHAMHPMTKIIEV